MTIQIICVLFIILIIVLVDGKSNKTTEPNGNQLCDILISFIILQDSVQFTCKPTNLIMTALPMCEYFN